MSLLKKPNIHIYEIVVALFVTTLIVSNIASVKLVGAGPLIMDAGTLLFPLAYILGDIITEVYGFRKMRSILFIGISMLVITMFTFWLVGAMPAAADWAGQSSYDAILGVVWRIVTASIIAILLGELINAYILAKLKIRDKGTRLWERVVGSSIAGNLVDTTVFSVIAFAGTMTAGSLGTLIFTVFAIKTAAEIIVSPLTVKIINGIKKVEKLDVYEAPSFRFRD